MEKSQSQLILQKMFTDTKIKYPNEYRRAFQILQQCITNIIRYPNEISYRKIFLTNQSIKENLLIIPEILDILRNIGFTPIEPQKQDVLIYKLKSLNILYECNSIISNLLSQIPQNQANSKNSQANNKPYEKKQIHHCQQHNKNINLNNINNINNSNNKVIIFLYDLSDGIVKGLSQALLGKEVEGIWHTAVYVYEREYFYAGGINKSQPRKTKFGKPVKEINFGYTHKTKKEFENYLKSIYSNFTSNNYDLISHNCNHFSDTALYFLTRNHLPSSILKQHEEILKTPLGKQIRPILEKLSGLANNQNQNQNQNNPLMLLPFLFGGILNNDDNDDNEEL